MDPRSRYHETITSLNQSAPAAMKILIKFLSDTLAGSRGHINYVAPRRRPQIDPAGIVSPFFLRYAEIVAPAPGGWQEAPVVPPRLNPCAVPSGVVV